jgi:potassium channel subfamily K, other eukaryote
MLTLGSGLTRKQRSLVISVMVLLCYIAFGAAVQIGLIEGLTYLNALYFTVVTIETIGMIWNFILE